jgi:hypothetical protein
MFADEASSGKKWPAFVAGLFNGYGLRLRIVSSIIRPNINSIMYTIDSSI